MSKEIVFSVSGGPQLPTIDYNAPALDAEQRLMEQLCNFKIETPFTGNVFIIDCMQDATMKKSENTSNYLTHSGTPLDKLIGHTFLWVYVSDYQLVFIDKDQNHFSFQVDGDCCSESWFSDILDCQKCLLNNKILRVVEIPTDDYNTEDGRCRQASDSVYAYGLETEKGVCKIYFRNSSNGYYGGWLYESDVIETTNLGFDRVKNSKGIVDRLNNTSILQKFHQVYSDWHNGQVNG